MNQFSPKEIALQNGNQVVHFQLKGVENMKERSAVYSGTFDPPTIGHIWMIEQGAKLFDKLTVVIGVNPQKRCLFSVDERIDMLRRATNKISNIEICACINQLMVASAKSRGAQFIIRGIRNAVDYEYELMTRNINGDLDYHITTVFLMPPREIAEVSSSMVKGLIGFEGWQEAVKKYLPRNVFKKLREKHNEQ